MTPEPEVAIPVEVTPPVAARPGLVHRVVGHHHFWALAVLALLLIYNVVHDPHFFAISIQDGHLYGNVIDVLNDGAPLMLVAIGMTFVIATGGVDLSVGCSGPLQGQDVPLDAEAGDDAVGDRRDVGGVPVLLALVDVADMHLDQRGGEHLEGVMQHHRGVRPPGRI